MSASKVPKCYRGTFQTEAFQNATYLDGSTVIEINNKNLTCFQHWKGKSPRFVKHLGEWGEVRIVKLCISTNPKIYDQGNPCMFVGYCLNDAGNTFRICDQDTKRVHLSWDIIWTGKMYFSGTQQIIAMPFIPNIESENLKNYFQDQAQREKSDDES
jgi:hypothetical protein